MQLLFALILVFCMLVPTSAFASEISLSSEKALYSPNDWIKIFVDIDGYTGKEVSWKATKPDDTVSQGVLTNIKASTATYTITRNAYDHQFGVWSIEYFHNDALQK